MILKENERINEINENLRLIEDKNSLTFGTDAYLLSAFLPPSWLPPSWLPPSWLPPSWLPPSWLPPSWFPPVDDVSLHDASSVKHKRSATKIKNFFIFVFLTLPYSPRDTPYKVQKDKRKRKRPHQAKQQASRTKAQAKD